MTDATRGILIYEGCLAMLCLCGCVAAVIAAKRDERRRAESVCSDEG